MFKLLQKPMFYRDVPADGGGGDPGDQSHMLSNITDGNLSLGELLDGQPDDTTAQTDATETETSKPAQKRRAKADKDEEEGQGAAEQDEESKANAEEEKQKDETAKPSDDEAKTLLEQAQASKKRLRADNDKLRESLADLEPKAQLLDNIQGMLQHPEHAGEGLKIILETASQIYGGDIIKALAAAGYEAKPIEPANPVSGIKEKIKASATDPEKIKAWGWNDDEVDMVAKMNGDLVDSILDGLGTVLAEKAGSAPKAEKKASSASNSFETEYKDVVQSIQEDVPLFECSIAEAKAAQAAKPKYPLEDAIRLVYADRIAGEKHKQEAHTRVKPMVTSNGKAMGTSVLDPDRIAKGPVSLSEALDSFNDLT